MSQFADRVQELAVPGINMVNPDLADILRGYKTALDAALMASRFLSDSQGRSSGRQQPASKHRNDALEVELNMHWCTGIFVQISVILLWCGFLCN